MSMSAMAPVVMTNIKMPLSVKSTVPIKSFAPVILARLEKKSELRNVYWLALF